MSQMHDCNDKTPRQSNHDELEQALLQGLSLTSSAQPNPSIELDPRGRRAVDSSEIAIEADSDVQGALALFAEAAQDLATAGVELSLGRHFACVDYCNQVVEKAAQAVSLRNLGRRSAYNHDLRALGALVGAPSTIQDEMEKHTPFHPEAFYVDTPPEEADDVINAEQASISVQSARNVLRWSKSIVLNLS